jgi:undecaprenyl-diphosphatase
MRPDSGREVSSGAGRSAGLRRGFTALRARAGALLTGCVVLSLLALAALFGLTRSVATGRTAALDERGMRWLDGRSTPWLDRAAVEATTLGDALVVATIALVAGTLLWQAGQRAYAGLLAAGVGGAWCVGAVLKELFDRPRPQLIEWRVHDVTSSSYPSGHATLSMVLAAILVYIVYRLSGRRGTGAAALLAGTAAVLMVGLSRVYLGVHYPSDVVAGYAVGFSWATMCALAVEAIRSHLRLHARTRPVRQGRSAVAGRSTRVRGGNAARTG